MPLKSTFTYLYRFISVMALSPLLASASQLRPENTDTLFKQHTQQQQAQQQQFDAKAPDVSLSVPVAASQGQFPDETPCFLIEHLVISGQEALPHWVPSLSGNIADSAASGWFSDALQNSIKNKDNSNVNK